MLTFETLNLPFVQVTGSGPDSTATLMFTAQS